MRLLVAPGAPLRGEIRVVADKSISHRAVIFAAIANGVSRLRNLSRGEDVRATVAAFRQMGVSINENADGEMEVHGVGLRGICQPPGQPPGAIDLGNSGTAMRLLAGLLCAQNWPSVLTGDASLTARPMARIIAPLTRMGARIESADGSGRPPLVISPAPQLRGIDYKMPVASAQVKSALLLAGLTARGDTVVTAPAPCRDHTERMLAAFGAPVAPMLGDGNQAGVRGGAAELRAVEVEVPSDLSAAAFFLVGASVIPGSEIVLRGVGVNPTRAGVLAILRRMGADLELNNQREIGGEPVADLRARSAELAGCEIDGRDVALAIDEIPALAVAAAGARGATVIRGAAELRVKESDRLSAVAAGLRALGVAVDERADGLKITGGGPGNLRGGRVDSRGDHRIAMAFAIAGGAAAGAVEVLDCENIATSFPDFCQTARDAGLNLKVDNDA